VANIPTISDDGRVMTDTEAYTQFRETGRHLGIFVDQKSADAAAEALHQRQEREYGSTKRLPGETPDAYLKRMGKL
jgi:hypothetical protein